MRLFRIKHKPTGLYIKRKEKTHPTLDVRGSLYKHTPTNTINKTTTLKHQGKKIEVKKNDLQIIELKKL